MMGSILVVFLMGAIGMAYFIYGKKTTEFSFLIFGVVLIFYPYLAQANRSISSIIQAHIDMKFKDSKLFLILCGSSMSFMEYQVLGYKSPL